MLQAPRALSFRSLVIRTGTLQALALGACSGPDLAPATPVALPDERIPLSIPEGGYCGPARSAAFPAEPQSPASGVVDADGTCAGSGGVSIAEIPPSPIAPLGVGYPDVPSTLPPHVAYLTFDDGPSEWTNDFLDILKEKGVLATFFVNAKNLKGDAGLDGTYRDLSGNSIVFRDVLARAVREGHWLGNHTVNHPDLAHITRAQITGEIEENELLVNRALVRAGEKPRILSLFRPPYGSPWFAAVPVSPAQLSSARISNHGLNILWTVASTDSNDWAIGEGYSRTASPIRDVNPPSYAVKMERVKQAVLSSRPVVAGEGFIVLMHDTHDATRDVLSDIIDGLVAAGYTFDTIEHYVDWRWGRPSMDLTPGPGLYQACVAQRNWGCVSFGVPVGTDRTREVCGALVVRLRGSRWCGRFGRTDGGPSAVRRDGHRRAAVRIR